MNVFINGLLKRIHTYLRVSNDFMELINDIPPFGLGSFSGYHGNRVGTVSKLSLRYIVALWIDHFHALFCVLVHLTFRVRNNTSLTFSK